MAMIGELPKRTVGRAMIHFLIMSAQAWARPHGGDLTQAFIFCTALSVNLEPFAPADPIGALAVAGEDDGAAAKRPISIHAVAASLSLPYETVRRKVMKMTAAGLIERNKAGIVVAAQALRAEPMRTAMAEVRTLLDEVLAVLTSVGIDLRAMGAMAGGAGRMPSDAMVGRIVMGAQIRSLEQMAPLFGDMVRAYVFCGVLRANIYHLLAEPALAARFATEPSIEAVRKPVTVAELTRQLDLPYATVHRHVGKMLAVGHLVDVEGGLLVPEESLSGDHVTEQNDKMSLEFFRMLTALAQVGMFSP